MFYMNSSFESVLGNMSEDELVGKAFGIEREIFSSRSIRLTRRSRATDSATREYNKFVHEKLKLSIRIAGKIGASQIIVHPTACPDGVDQRQFNIDFTIR